MGFFKELKDDLTQAVNELLPEEEQDKENKVTEEEIVNTFDSEDDISEEATDNAKMKEWLEEFALEDETETVDNIEDELDSDLVDYNENTDEIQEDEEENMEDNVDLELLEAMNAKEEEDDIVEVKEKPIMKQRTSANVLDDDVTVISKGTSINGSISSEGSLEIMGIITGDVECLGKLSITGKIIGNSSAAEVYVNTERLEGNIISEGSVKVGLGTVIIGDITATSGVIAGAVKGEIDVNGPIVIDSTAIIKGNIKAKTVQINNGAVIEGFCSLSYSAVDVDTIFE